MGAGAVASSHCADKDRYLTGLFPACDIAERAYQGVVARGYRSGNVNLMMPDETRNRQFGKDNDYANKSDTRTVGGCETELGSKAAEGANMGAGIGGTLGAIAAAAAAAGASIALPGLGWVIAGPVAAALAVAGAAVAGGAARSLVGALIGWNIPEERVKEYEEGNPAGWHLDGTAPAQR